MLLMENPPEIDTPGMKKARRLLSQETVFLVMREAVQVGKNEVSYLMLSNLDARKRREITADPDKFLRRLAINLRTTIRSGRFRKLLHGMGWHPTQAVPLLMANLEGNRIEETESIINKVKDDKGRVINGKEARKARGITERPHNRGTNPRGN